MLTFSPDPLDDALTRQALLASAALHDELADHLNERLYVLGPHASPEAVLSVARQVLEEHVGPLANLLGDSIVAAYVTGAARFADRLPGGMFPDEPLPGTTWTWDGSPVWLPAIGNAAEDLARRRLVMKPDYEQLSAEARQQAFTVAHVTSQGTLDKIRNAIIDAVGDGKSFPEFREDVIDAVGHSPIGPGHLDNVFRTNVASAMNRGQEEVWAQPVIRERFPYVLAEGVDDSRQTALCHAINHGGLDGTGIYRADDPVWQHFKAPRHHRCRCSCTYLTVEDAAARGVKSARRWLETGEDPQDFVPWPDVELPAGWVSAGPVAMSVRHAPKGGITIHGKPYKGGRFLPKDAPEIGKPPQGTPTRDEYEAGLGRRLFHGAKRPFDEHPKAGSYWADVQKAAEAYLRQTDGEGQLHEGHLRPGARIKDLRKGYGDEDVQEFLEIHGKGPDNYTHFTELAERDDFRQFLIDKGYDGFMLEENSSNAGDDESVEHRSYVDLTGDMIAPSYERQHGKPRPAASYRQPPPPPPPAPPQDEFTKFRSASAGMEPHQGYDRPLGAVMDQSKMLYSPDGRLAVPFTLPDGRKGFELRGPPPWRWIVEPASGHAGPAKGSPVDKPAIHGNAAASQGDAGASSPGSDPPRELWRITKQQHIQQVNEEGQKRTTDFPPKIHRVIRNYDELQETLHAIFGGSESLEQSGDYFVRSSPDVEREIRDNYRSSNAATGGKESGLSVSGLTPGLLLTRAEVARYVVGEAYQYAALGGWRAWIVKGRRVGYGGDGEPVIRAKTAEVVSEIDKDFLYSPDHFGDVEWVRRHPQESLIHHRQAVENAVKQGKPVPPEVLADYPDLSK